LSSRRPKDARVLRRRKARLAELHRHAGTTKPRARRRAPVEEVAYVTETRPGSRATVVELIEGADGPLICTGRIHVFDSPGAGCRCGMEPRP